MTNIGFNYDKIAGLKQASYDPIVLDKDENGAYTEKKEDPKFAFDPVTDINTPSPRMINDQLTKMIGNEEDTTKKDKGLFGYKGDDGPSFGDNLMDTSGEIINAGFQQYANFKNESQSNEERTAQTLSSAASGAQIGFSLGGPLGAGIGALAMGGLSMIDGASDKRKNIETAHEAEVEKFDKKKKERRKNYNLGNSLLGFNSTQLT